MDDRQQLVNGYLYVLSEHPEGGSEELLPVSKEEIYNALVISWQSISDRMCKDPDSNAYVLEKIIDGAYSLGKFGSQRQPEQILEECRRWLIRFKKDTYKVTKRLFWTWEE